MYHCGKSFLIEPLLLSYESSEKSIGVVLTNGEVTEIYLVDEQKRFYLKEKLLGNLPTGHKKGGQSAPRFQRMYISALDAYNKKIVQSCLKHFRKDGANFVKKVIISGNGIRKKHLYDELVSYFPSIDVFSFGSIAELLGGVDIRHHEEEKMHTHLLELLETSLDILGFGKEVLLNHHEYKTIVCTSGTIGNEEEIPKEKIVLFHESTKEYKWLQSFGGIIGIRYYSVNNSVDEIPDEDIEIYA